MMIATRPSVAAAAAIAMAFLAVMGLTAPAHAQSAEAETLFREAKRLMKSGKLADACDKFDASERLEPTAGTELNLADCREKNGQLATAWAMFLRAAAAAKRADNDGKREAEARRRAAALESRLVYLTISVPVGSRVDGLVIKRNGTVIDPGLWDQRVPVDPDEYTIAGAAPGFEPWSTSVVIKTKARTVEVPALARHPGANLVVAPGRSSTEPNAGEASVARAASDGDGAREDLRSAAPGRFTGRRKVAVAVAAVGVAAAGVSLGFGLQARSVEGEADAICPGTECTDARAVDLNRAARRNALVANIGLATAGAAVIAAAVLWFTGSPTPGGSVSVAPILGGDRAGISFARVF
jgi:hypothetical protein